MAKATAKKRWFKVVAPKLFNNRIVGETPAFDPKTAVGKTMKVNMFTLTDNMKKQNTDISLLIENVQGDQAITSMTGYHIQPTSIKRLVRKGRTRLDQTLKVVTKDNKIATLKILLITRNIVQGSVSRGIQTLSRKMIIKKASDMKFEQICEAAVYGKLQKEIKEALNKIYPIRTCEIRSMKLERFMKDVEINKIKARLKKTPQEIQEEAEKAKEEAEKKGEDSEEGEENESDEDTSEEGGDSSEKEEKPEAEESEEENKAEDEEKESEDKEEDSKKKDNS